MDKNRMKSPNKEVVVVDSLNRIDVPLVELEPLVRTEKYSEEIAYSRIKVERLSKDFLRELLKVRQTKEANVTQISNYLVYEYSGKTPIFISLKDGRIYGEKDDHNHRLEAVILLQKLNKFGLVEGYERKQRHRYGLRFLERLGGTLECIE